MRENKAVCIETDLTRTNFPQSNPEQKQNASDTCIFPRFGACHCCNRPVSIPGLDRSLCDFCGWIEDPEFRARRLAEEAIRKAERQRIRQESGQKAAETRAHNQGKLSRRERIGLVDAHPGLAGGDE